MLLRSLEGGASNFFGGQIFTAPETLKSRASMFIFF